MAGKKISQCVKERGDHWRTTAPRHVSKQREYNAEYHDAAIMDSPTTCKRMLLGEVKFNIFGRIPRKG